MSTRNWRRAGVVTVTLVATIGTGNLPGLSAAVPSALPATAVATAPSTATLHIPASVFKSYQESTITLAKGGTLRVKNEDNVRHTVTSDATDSNGQPLFDTTVDGGTTVVVSGVSKLAPGKYPFHCRIHTQMQATLVIQGTGGGTTAGKVTFAQPLVIPKVLTGAHLTIPIKTADVRVLPNGPLTRMWTFGGTYPGPTIRRPAGQDTKVTFVNRLPQKVGSVTVHFHGDHHTAANDGQPTRFLIGTGKSRTYNYPLTDHGKPELAAFQYYHDHRMQETSRNNWFGLQGMFIVDDKHSKSLGLPSGPYDVPLLVNDRSFTSSNQLVNPFPATPTMQMTGPTAPPGDGTVGNHILANGRYRPYFKVAAHRYRLRLLNGSNFTTYDFALSDGRSFTQVGTGDALLPHPVVRQNILLGPAQRVDVVVNFRRELGKRVVLKSIARPNRPAEGTGTPTAPIMQFRVNRTAPDSTRIPSALQTPPAINAPSKVSAVWAVNVGGDQTNGSYWTINGKPFDPSRVDATVPLGATRTWLLRNDSTVTHFIHIHEEEWHTIARDGKRPPPWERGLEDTWRLDPGETVKVAAHFTDYTGIFMIHCHMLDHEDHGLMAQFAVVKPGAGLPAGYHDDHSAAPGHAARSAVVQAAALPHSTLLDSVAANAAWSTPNALAQLMCGPAWQRPKSKQTRLWGHLTF